MHLRAFFTLRRRHLLLLVWERVVSGCAYREGTYLMRPFLHSLFALPLSAWTIGCRLAAERGIANAKFELVDALKMSASIYATLLQLERAVSISPFHSIS